MDISSIGKQGLINRLVSDIKPKPQHSSTIKGIGDDAAILCYGKTNLAVTTDTLVEGINFDLTYFPLQHLGYKAASVGFSNLYAMNALPRQLFVSIAVSSKFSVESIETLYMGIKHCCERHRVDLAGGDTVTSITGLIITVTAIGEVKPTNAVYRNTAQKGDFICVSGDLGAAYMGLQILEREKKIFLEDRSIQPQLEAYKHVVGRQLRPKARRDIIDFFSSVNLKPTSMIDISNGLSSELLQICNSSKVGCEIYSHKIPIADDTITAVEEFSLEPIIVALNGGDDFELLFTIKATDYDKVAANNDISIVGYVTHHTDGFYLVSEGGSRIEIR